MSARPLVIAVPSKGRLQENAASFFARAGLVLERPRGARDYRGTVRGVAGIEIVFLSAGEIVGQLASGAAHLGVTGADLVQEALPDADATVTALAALGFGAANVVVAVPQSWIDVRTMSDLDEVAADLRARRGHRLRVATKYLNLTRTFFAAHGVADYRIVESLGATEGAPAANTADLIVDITTTGATLAANGLKVLDDGTILRSEAHLVASLRARWDAPARAAAGRVLGRIAAEEEARTTREVTATFEGADVGSDAARIARERGGRVRGGELVLRCPAGEAFDLVDRLTEAGAAEVTVRTLDYVFRGTGGPFARLIARIGSGGLDTMTAGAGLPQSDGMAAGAGEGS